MNLSIIDISSVFQSWRFVILNENPLDLSLSHIIFQYEYKNLLTLYWTVTPQIEDGVIKLYDQIMPVEYMK